MKRLYKGSLILLSTAILAGCGILKSDLDETKGWSPAKLYDSARESVREGEWKAARRYLGAVQSRYPYSTYAQQALIDLAYVNWKDDEVDQARVSIDRFLALYPGHPSTDYMLYLKGLLTFTPPSSFLSSYTGQDPSERDPKGLRQSYQAFQELVSRFPDSRYANDAQLRLTWLVSTIADSEANIAQYYYTRHGYIAAINRAQGVLRDFSGVTAAEKALYIMMKSYEALDMPQEAEDTKRILDHNFPNSKYYQYGIEGKRSWTDFFTPKSWFN